MDAKHIVPQGSFLIADYKAAAVIVAAVIPLAFQNVAAADQKVLLSYEATPSAGFPLPRLTRASHDDRVVFSAKVLKESCQELYRSTVSTL
ncbi:hypothetical protein NXC12_PD00371 (plasmid) [Rhizobium etli]|uniref:Uncharacterized protein n=1 Tax=Rhizobium etli TaxID=29449 RepID=A0AAN1BLY7_RHIET|nr:MULTISPECIES: hypothetical protein [Rhizobium]ARO32475.1 hypothetical protein NXC14_PA00196 [Rhizobium sp. NXC14]ARQ13462.1 hypothetical protein NXC12_PD00371 [Rhizobium etli]